MSMLELMLPTTSLIMSLSLYPRSLSGLMTVAARSASRHVLPTSLRQLPFRLPLHLSLHILPLPRHPSKPIPESTHPPFWLPSLLSHHQLQPGHRRPLHLVLFLPRTLLPLHLRQRPRELLQAL